MNAQQQYNEYLTYGGQLDYDDWMLNGMYAPELDMLGITYSEDQALDYLLGYLGAFGFVAGVLGTAVYLLTKLFN